MPAMAAGQNPASVATAAVLGGIAGAIALGFVAPIAIEVVAQDSTCMLKESRSLDVDLDF